MLRMVWLVVALDQLEYREMDGVKGNLFSFLCSTWAQFWKCLQDFFRIKQVKATKTFSRSCLQVRKAEKPRQKEFLMTSKCLKLKLEESHHVLLVQETCSFENIFVII